VSQAYKCFEKWIIHVVVLARHSAKVVAVVTVTVVVTVPCQSNWSILCPMATRIEIFRITYTILKILRQRTVRF